jgi:AcrR family transcriptional regulator
MRGNVITNAFLDIAEGVFMAKATGRSPEAVGVGPESRATRFMKSALAILGETGRTDFTVLEVVERSKTSLRSFYQHFSTKDELLLALIDRIMAESTNRWREETNDLDGPTALRRLIDRITMPASSSKQDSINRGLTFYNDHLAESLPSEYARVLSPLHQLIQDILDRGIAEGAFRTGLDVETTAALIMQSVLGAMTAFTG